MKHKNVNRWLAVVVALSLMAALFLPGTAFARPDTVVMVIPPSQSVGTDATFTVDINVAPDTAIAGMQFSLSFNASLLTATGVIEGNLFKQGGANTTFQVLGGIDNTAGTITDVVGFIMGAGSVSSPGTFATISFTAKTAPGTSPLDLSSVIVGNPQGQSVPIIVADGSVTITGAPPEYDLTMAASPVGWGTATDETGTGPYEEGEQVSIEAVANPGYEFVNWTATAGEFDDAEAEETTFTMPAQDVTVTANFEEIPPEEYVLTMAENPTEGGTATDETGTGPYEEGEQVSIEAVANPGYEFVNWTATAGEFDDAEAEETTFTMPAQDVTVTANFEEIPPEEYVLTMVENPTEGGTATDETGTGPYEEGEQVSIQAVANPGYEFVNWTATAGEFDDAEAEETTFTMPAQDVTVTANFEEIPPEEYVLTMAENPTEGGTATDETGTGPYEEGEQVSIQAVANPGYEFVNWTAAPAGAFGNATATTTNFTMPAQNATVTAHFELEVALTRIVGETREVNCALLPGVTVTLYQDGGVVTSTVSDGSGNYTLTVPEFGNYNVTASKNGFRNKTRTISMNQTGAHILDFVGEYGLIPNGPSMSYVLACINRWKFGESPCNLNMSTVLAVINAWKFPV